MGVVFLSEGSFEDSDCVFEDEAFDEGAASLVEPGFVDGFDVVPESGPVCAFVVVWEEDVVGEGVPEGEWFGVVFVGEVPEFGVVGAFVEELVVSCVVCGSGEPLSGLDEDVPDDDGVFDGSVFFVEESAVEEVVLALGES